VTGDQRRRVTLREARRIAVTAQMLGAERPAGLLPLVERLTFLQLDPTAAIAPSADLVAWSRLGPSYDPEELRTALERDRTLFEHNAMVRPTSDLRLHLADMTAPRGAQGQGWVERNDRFRRDVLDLLGARGPLMSRDIPDTHVEPWPSSGWTNNRNVTQMLELLAMRGEVAISGRQGRQLGLALSFAWAAYPFSLLALQENTNDLMIAALLVLSLAALRSPPGRGALLGLAAAAKFAPLAIAPLLATGTGQDRTRSRLRFGVAFAVVCVVATVPFIPDGGLRELYDTTIGYQLGRGSPFSLWALHPSLDWMQTLLKVGAVALAAAVCFFPRERSPRQVVALAAAVMIAVQLPATHWFYFYLAWIAPLVLATSMSAYREPVLTASAAPAVDRWTRPAALPD